MKNIVRNLDYYGYEDKAMYNRNEKAKKEIFEISKVKEHKNEKYIKNNE